jgi:hypothetical protein
METIITLLQSFQLNILEVSIAALLVFTVGYRIGNKKVKKLTEQIWVLQRDVLDLNAEILYGKDESETPVIEIKHEPLKGNKIAK